MLSRDLKLYLLLICLPAAVLTGLGIVFLARQSAAAAARADEVRQARAEQVSADVQDAVLDSGVDAAARPEALLALEAGEAGAHPRGAFEWAPRTGLVWHRGVPAPVVADLARRTFLKDWTDGSRASAKKPPKRGHFAWGEGPDAVSVFWARGPANDGRVLGVVFAGDPVASGPVGATLWPIALLLAVLLACVLVAGAWLMARAAAKARRDDETKTTFVSNASHELKTPLAGIGLWIDLLRKGRLRTDEQRAHAYDVIAGENARMVRLVQNLLDFSRLEAGRNVFRFSSVDVDELVAEVVDVMRGGFAAHGLDLRPGGAGCIRGDADAVKQILVNLLGNAAKYAAADGPVEIATAVEGGRVRVSVSDRGPGLSPAARARVFERFYRADDALDAKTGGLGLGLSISQGLARGMGGELSVAPRDGGGCVFTLELPSQPDGPRSQESQP